jgi:hypothetical protein
MKETCTASQNNSCAFDTGNNTCVGLTLNSIFMTQSICLSYGASYNWDGSKCVDCSAYPVNSCVSTVCLATGTLCVGKTKENAQTISQCLSISPNYGWDANSKACKDCSQYTND